MAEQTGGGREAVAVHLSYFHPSIHIFAGFAGWARTLMREIVSRLREVDLI